MVKISCLYHQLKYFLIKQLHYNNMFEICATTDKISDIECVQTFDRKLIDKTELEPVVQNSVSLMSSLRP